MRKLFVLFTISIVSVFSSYGQVGKQFPKMETESLTNKMVNIPEDLSGKYSLIGLAFTKKAEGYLKGWFDPIYNQFIYKPEKPSIFDFSFDIHTYLIPMFTGAKRVAYKKVMNKVRKTVDKRIQPNVMFYKGELSFYKEELSLENKELPYFFVLDKTGKIVHMTKGKYSDKKMQEIVDAVKDAME